VLGSNYKRGYKVDEDDLEGMHGSVNEPWTDHVAVLSPAIARFRVVCRATEFRYFRLDFWPKTVS
jgi:hypothetical protein